jgi:hypothetical protein
MVLKLSAREQDAFTPMMIRATPAIKRTTPTILVILMVGLFASSNEKDTQVGNGGFVGIAWDADFRITAEEEHGCDLDALFAAWGEGS